MVSLHLGWLYGNWQQITFEDLLGLIVVGGRNPDSTPIRLTSLVLLCGADLLSSRPPGSPSLAKRAGWALS